MSMPIREGSVNVVQSLSNKEDMIYMTAELVWGLKPDQLPKAKFDELNRVLDNSLEQTYGPCRVKGIFAQGVLMVRSYPGFRWESYKPTPCSLDTCMVTDAAFKCGRCMALYCSEGHQKLDWKRHKVECILPK